MRLDWGDKFPGKIPQVRDPLTSLAETLSETRGQRTPATTRPFTPEGVFSYPSNPANLSRPPGSYYGWVLPPADDNIISEADGVVYNIDVGDTHYGIVIRYYPGSELDPPEIDLEVFSDYLQSVPLDYVLNVSVDTTVVAGSTSLATRTTTGYAASLPTVDLDEQAQLQNIFAKFAGQVTEIDEGGFVTTITVLIALPDVTRTIIVPGEYTVLVSVNDILEVGTPVASPGGDVATFYYVNVLLEKGEQVRARVPVGTSVEIYDPIIVFPHSTGGWLGFIGGGKGDIDYIWDIAKTEEIISPGLSGSVEIWRFVDGVLTATGVRVLAYATTVPAYYSLPVHTQVKIEWHENNGRWFITGVYQ